MSITPVGGWDLAPTTPQSRPTEAACPGCGGTDWKLASLVYSGGLSVSTSTSRGGALGVGVSLQNGGVMVGGARTSNRTRGTTQTLASARAAPPQMRSGLPKFLGVLCVGSALVSLVSLRDGDFGVFLWQALLATSFGVLGWNVGMRRKEQYDDAIQVYESTKMCQRCGTFYY